MCAGGGPRDRRGGAASVQFAFDAFAERTGAGGRLALVPHAGQQQRAEPGVERGAVGGVGVEHRVVVWVSWVHAMAVGVVDLVDVGVRGAGLGVVGPGVGRRRWRGETGLGEDVPGPERALWGEGDGAGGEVWVHWNSRLGGA